MAEWLAHRFSVARATLMADWGAFEAAVAPAEASLCAARPLRVGLPLALLAATAALIALLVVRKPTGPLLQAKAELTRQYAINR